MRTRTILAMLPLLAMLSAAPWARAQFNPLALTRLRPQKPATQAPQQKSQAGADYHRLIEIQIELAWLGDPITFPYLLEAKVDAAAVRVRGKVPDAAIREQALKLARLHCPMKVSDALTTDPGLIQHTLRMDSFALQQSALSALRESLPWANHGIRLHCEADGRVCIDGQVKTIEEKLAVSKSLQRMHGCACVVNQLEVGNQRQAPTASTPKVLAAPMDPNLPLARLRKKPESRFRTLLCLPGKHGLSRKLLAAAEMLNAKPPSQVLPSQPPGSAAVATAAAANIQRVAYNPSPPPLSEKTPPPSKSALPKLEFRGESRAVPDRPFETRGVVILPDGDPSAMSAHQLKERIYRVCGQAANNVGVNFKSPRDVEIFLHARSTADASRLANVIMQIPELMTYHVDIRVKLIR